jgi:hypothetical protein
MIADCQRLKDSFGLERPTHSEDDVGKTTVENEYMKRSPPPELTGIYRLS